MHWESSKFTFQCLRFDHVCGDLVQVIGQPDRNEARCKTFKRFPLELVVASLVAGKSTVGVVATISDCVRFHKNSLGQLDSVLPVVFRGQANRFCGRIKTLGSAGPVEALHVQFDRGVVGLGQVLELKPNPLKPLLFHLTVVGQVKGVAIVWVVGPS